jgi:hypothetical protein
MHMAILNGLPLERGGGSTSASSSSNSNLAVDISAGENQWLLRFKHKVATQLASDFLPQLPHFADAEGTATT